MLGRCWCGQGWSEWSDSARTARNLDNSDKHLPAGMQRWMECEPINKTSSWNDFSILKPRECKAIGLLAVQGSSYKTDMLFFLNSWRRCSRSFCAPRPILHVCWIKSSSKVVVFSALHPPGLWVRDTLPVFWQSNMRIWSFWANDSYFNLACPLQHALKIHETFTAKTA